MVREQLHPVFFSWPHETTPEAVARNVEGLKKIGSHYGSILAVAQSYADRKGLQIDWNNPITTVSKLAVITQAPKEFDFPGARWPVQFHYAGPFQGRP
jgi:zeaxanthin glucosyltransferase